MKPSKTLAAVLALMFMLTACSTAQTELNQNQTPPKNEETVADVVEITLSDDEIKVGGVLAESDAENDVYIENDIIYYESGKDFTYGEGTEEDAHSAEDGLEEGGAGGVGDFHGVELGAERGVGGGVAAAAAAVGGGAELERGVEPHRRPCNP